MAGWVVHRNEGSMACNSAGYPTTSGPGPRVHRFPPSRSRGDVQPLVCAVGSRLRAGVTATTLCPWVVALSVWGFCGPSWDRNAEYLSERVALNNAHARPPSSGSRHELEGGQVKHAWPSLGSGSRSVRRPTLRHNRWDFVVGHAPVDYLESRDV